MLLLLEKEFAISVTELASVWFAFYNWLGCESCLLELSLVDSLTANCDLHCNL